MEIPLGTIDASVDHDSGASLLTVVCLELFAYNWSFLLAIGAFSLTIELLCLQWESASDQHLNGL